MFLELFKLVFEINFFVFPISAGFLTYRKIHGKTGGRPLRMMITSIIMLMVSFVGIVVNETPAHRVEMLHNVEKSLNDFVQEKQ